MLLRRKLPETGELVVGTVREIFEYGAYVSLDEFEGLIAYLPRGEVSSKWVRNIRDYIKEGQKGVFKVIRVDKRKGQVDVSLRRVTPSEKRQKMILWKRAQKAHKILEIVASKLGISLEEVYEEAGWKLEDKYGEIYAGLEEAVMRGMEALLEAGVPEYIAQVLKEEADKHIEIKKVKVKGIIYLQTLHPKGVEHIKEILTTALDNANIDGVNVKIYTIGSPRYRVEVEATDYKSAEEALKKVLETAESMAKEYGVAMKFERERR